MRSRCLTCYWRLARLANGLCVPAILTDGAGCPLDYAEALLLSLEQGLVGAVELTMQQGLVFVQPDLVGGQGECQGVVVPGLVALTPVQRTVQSVLPLLGHDGRLDAGESSEFPGGYGHLFHQEMFRCALRPQVVDQAAQQSLKCLAVFPREHQFMAEDTVLQAVSA